MSVHINKWLREEVHNAHFGQGAELWHWISRTERGKQEASSHNTQYKSPTGVSTIAKQAAVVSSDLQDLTA